MRRAALLLFLAACKGEGLPAAPESHPPVVVGYPDASSIDAGDDGASAPCVEPAYPAGPYGTAVGATIANLTWPAGMLASGQAEAVALDDALAGCPGDRPVLILRLDAAWCGTCRGYAANSNTLLSSDVGGSVRLFDVVLFDHDNAPASALDAEAWHRIEDVPTEIAVDPMLSVAGLLPASTQLPVILVVDARTMTLEGSLSNPTEDALEQAIRAALASMNGQPAPTAPAPVLTDGRFSRDQWALIAQMALTDPPPPDPSNAFADSIPAAAIGSKLFSDTRLSPGLSPNNSVACASCHSPLRQLTDGSPTPPDGVGRVTRNSPSLTFAAYIPWAFYDGRADSLWSQSLDPIEAKNEFGSSRLFVAHAIYQYYRPQYEAVFGAMPPLYDPTRFPPSGMPGDPAWMGMATSDQEAVNGRSSSTSASRSRPSSARSAAPARRSMRTLPGRRRR